MQEENFEHRSNLFYAVFYKQIEIVKMLLAHGADPNAKDKYGKTPLDTAKLFDKQIAAIIESAIKNREIGVSNATAQ